ncbi:NAD-dependent epimerase/dehydratase family protein [Actinoplanes oblitus]|uniref:NAD-dependent epimerase/dehydratase family protein n=1 Tax=Actinoplanes oblitus TaxID=3040509 RepID=A0ABY8WDP7_9ACTN|nr:NAD-dependent epimerase/dehydratase family protein [Actinoplanes oblitus]WIM94514.1 NAD-dependent epimerase/dehydratase family protein [Actinoplanes oblitus]
MIQLTATRLVPPGVSDVAVTGGSGFIGRHLVRALAERGLRVHVVDLSDLPPELSELDGVTLRRADLRDHAQVRAALNGVDTVFHLAGNASGTVSVENPRFDFETNGLGTCNVGNACAELGVRRLVYLSSAIVYGVPEQSPMTENHSTMPFLPYGASKLSGELVLRSLHRTIGLPVVIGRSFVVYGPGEDPRRAGGEVSQFLRWHLNRRAIPVVGDVDGKTRDFIHVRDLCDSLVALAESGTEGEVYNLGSGEEVSMRQLADAVESATGRPAELVPDRTVLSDTYRLVADVSKLAGIGFRARVPLADGIRELAGLLGENPELPTVAAIFHRTPAVTVRAVPQTAGAGADAC